MLTLSREIWFLGYSLGSRLVFGVQRRGFWGAERYARSTASLTLGLPCLSPNGSLISVRSSDPNTNYIWSLNLTNMLHPKDHMHPKDQTRHPKDQ